MASHNHPILGLDLSLEHVGLLLDQHEPTSVMSKCEGTIKNLEENPYHPNQSKKNRSCSFGWLWDTCLEEVQLHCCTKPCRMCLLMPSKVRPLDGNRSEGRMPLIYLCDGKKSQAELQSMPASCSGQGNGIPFGPPGSCSLRNYHLVVLGTKWNLGPSCPWLQTHLGNASLHQCWIVESSALLCTDTSHQRVCSTVP